MAKTVKIKVSRVAVSGGVQLVRPPEYPTTDLHNKISVIARELAEDVALRGGNDEHWICVVKDSEAAALLLSDDVIEITQEEAETLGALWAPQVDVITDQSIVRAICAKVTGAAELTQNEKDAITPSHASSGINRTPAFSGILATETTRIA